MKNEMEKKNPAVFHDVTKNYSGCFYYVLFHYFRVKVNMEINMLQQHNTVIKEVAILILYEGVKKQKSIRYKYLWSVTVLCLQANQWNLFL